MSRKHRSLDELTKARANAAREAQRHPSGTSRSNNLALQKAKPCPCDSPGCPHLSEEAKKKKNRVDFTVPESA